MLNSTCGTDAPTCDLEKRKARLVEENRIAHKSIEQPMIPQSSSNSVGFPVAPVVGKQLDAGCKKKQHFAIFTDIF